jgi:hypothetical protein
MCGKLRFFGARLGLREVQAKLGLPRWALTGLDVAGPYLRKTAMVETQQELPRKQMGRLAPSWRDSKRKVLKLHSEAPTKLSHASVTQARIFIRAIPAKQ